MGKLLDLSNYCPVIYRYQRQKKTKKKSNIKWHRRVKVKICDRVEQDLEIKKGCCFQLCFQLLMPYKYFIPFRRKPVFYITYMGGHSTWQTCTKFFSLAEKEIEIEIIIIKSQTQEDNWLKTKQNKKNHPAFSAVCWLTNHRSKSLL